MCFSCSLFFFLFGSGPWHSVVRFGYTRHLRWAHCHCDSGIVFGAIYRSVCKRQQRFVCNTEICFFLPKPTMQYAQMDPEWTNTLSGSSRTSSSSKGYMPFAEWMKTRILVAFHVHPNHVEWMHCVRLFERNKLQKRMRSDKTEMVFLFLEEMTICIKLRSQQFQWFAFFVRKQLQELDAILQCEWGCVISLLLRKNEWMLCCAPCNKSQFVADIVPDSIRSFLPIECCHISTSHICCDRTGWKTWNKCIPLALPVSCNFVFCLFSRFK